jgi:glycosyltransferase involved in cell wall biosynthesis
VKEFQDIAVQYMEVSTPMVASPAGGVTETVRHGESGFFARTEEEPGEPLTDNVALPILAAPWLGAAQTSAGTT